MGENRTAVCVSDYRFILCMTPLLPPPLPLPLPPFQLTYGTSKGKAYTEEEDRFILCMTHRLGYGLWDDLKAEVCLKEEGKKGEGRRNGLKEWGGGGGQTEGGREGGGGRGRQRRGEGRLGGDSVSQLTGPSLNPIPYLPPLPAGAQELALPV